jgi:hypothetical protein
MITKSTQFSRNFANSRRAMLLLKIFLFPCVAAFSACETPKPLVTESSNTSIHKDVDSKPSIASNSKTLATPKPDPALVAVGYSLSDEAGEVAELMDNDRYVAAEELFKTYLPNRPKDATLYCQYVRFLIEGFSLVDDPFILSPVAAEDRYRVSRLINRTITLASEFDPKIKPYLADLILKSLYKQALSQASKGEGYIASAAMILISDNFMIAGLNGHNKILFAWTAIELDAATGKKWADRYRELVRSFANTGKSTSAMWTANLSGDLSNGADETSNVDFERAARAFLDSLDSGKGDIATINDTSSLFVEIFKLDIKRAAKEKDAIYVRLLSRLKELGASHELYQKNDAMP